MLIKNSNAGLAMGIFLVITGIAHFIFPQTLDRIVPSVLPGNPRFYTIVSGVAELVIGVALLTPLSIMFAGKPLRLWAAYAALALFVAVYPANIKMAIDWRSREMPMPLFAYSRLPLQFGLFYWAYAIIKSLR